MPELENPTQLELKISGMYSDFSKLLEKKSEEVSLIGKALTETTEALKNVNNQLAEMRTWSNTYTDQAKKIDERLADLETKSNRRDGDGEGGGEDRGPFKHLGEQMLAVKAASEGDSTAKSQLMAVKAPTGLNEGVLSEGGFMVQTDFSNELLRRAIETGLLASRCRTIPISGNANSTKINGVQDHDRATGSRWGGVRAYWENEADTMVASKPAFRQIELKLKKLTGLCYATDENLEDAPQLASIMNQAFAEEFGFVIDQAIISGDGAGQPLGYTNSNAMVVIPKAAGQPAATFLFQNAITMLSRLWPRSLNSAVWLANMNLLPQFSTMTIDVGTGGAPVFLPANGAAGQPLSTLFGRPILFIEQAEALGTQGDVQLVDLSQMLLAQKGGVRSASSIHVRFLQNETAFRFVLRIDAQPVWNKPLTPYKQTTATQSPFLTLATRA